MASYFRRVIKITAYDSPNVSLGLRQQALGLEPTDEIVVPGVLTWSEFQRRLATWDLPRQTIGLFANFYAGPEELLFPPQWLDRAEQLAIGLRGLPRRAEAIGIDPAEGGDKTAMAAVDRWGLIELVSKKTPDTNIVVGEVIAFGLKHNVPAEKWIFDKGGGGTQHGHRLRAKGYNVKLVGFGETVEVELKRSRTMFEEKREVKDDKYTYKNRRAEMYHTTSLLVDPANEGWAIPGDSFGPVYAELRRQLAVMPKLTDEEGRYWMLPKNKRNADDKRKTLVELIGHSPDEADALALGVAGMMGKIRKPVAGGIA